MGVNLGLSEESRKAVVDILARLLADEYVLYTKTRNYHWNVVGPQFAELHALFEKQYEELNEVVDDVAERIRALGHPAPGTLAEFLKLARLAEHPGEPLSAEGMIRALLADHEALVRRLREDLAACADRYGDMGTNDFLTGLMERHEKTAWMLRALVASRPEA
mgnify:CR=1 FL=1